MLIRCVAISDTHNKHNKVVVPECDILFHAGDATMSGNVVEVQNFLEWFSKQPSKHKVFCAGNHDWMWQRDRKTALEFLKKYPNITYLQDEFTEIEGLKIFGSPWQPFFHNWAFNATKFELQQIWKNIPNDIDILLTHGPAYGILDVIPYGDNAGCYELRKRYHDLFKLKTHIFGHIHYSYGVYESDGIKYINAASCDESYRISNPPIIFEVENGKNGEDSNGI